MKTVSARGIIFPRLVLAKAPPLFNNNCSPPVSVGRFVLLDIAPGVRVVIKLPVPLPVMSPVRVIIGALPVFTVREKDVLSPLVKVNSLFTTEPVIIKEPVET